MPFASAAVWAPASVLGCFPAPAPSATAAFIARRCAAVTGALASSASPTSSKNATPFAPTDCGVPVGAAMAGAGGAPASTGASVIGLNSAEATTASASSTARMRPSRIAWFVGAARRRLPRGIGSSYPGGVMIHVPPRPPVVRVPTSAKSPIHASRNWMTWYRSGIAGTVSTCAPARRSSTASAYTVSRLGATTKCDVGLARPGRTLRRLTPNSCANVCMVRTVVTNGKPARKASCATASADARAGPVVAADVDADVGTGDALPPSLESEQPAATPANATPAANTNASCRNWRRVDAVTSRRS